MLIKNTVLRKGNNFYEVVSSKKRVAVIKQIYIPRNYAQSPVIVTNKNHKITLWPGSNEFKFYSNVLRGQESNRRPIVQIFPVSKQSLKNTQVDLRLSLNNILSKLFCTKEYSKRLLEQLIIRRLEG